MPFKLEIEHIHPRALDGKTVEENLWLACRECNAHKAAKIKAIEKFDWKDRQTFQSAPTKLARTF